MSPVKARTPFRTSAISTSPELEKARFKNYVSNFHTILKVLANGFSLPEAGREGIRKLVASYGSLQI